MTADQLRALQELAHELDELTKHPGWPVLVNYASYGDAMLAHKQKYVLEGRCSSPEEYQKYSGWIAGAQAVLDIPGKVAEIRDRESKKAAGETGE